MTYEGRHARGLNLGLAAACILLSVIGFAAAGVIPTESGTNPAVGWTIVAACFAAAAVFLMRAFDGNVQARIDGQGVYARRHAADPIGWDRISGAYPMRAGIQRIVRFKQSDEVGGTREFGINTTFYDRGMADLLQAVRHHRPDLGL